MIMHTARGFMQNHKHARHTAKVIIFYYGCFRLCCFKMPIYLTVQGKRQVFPARNTTGAKYKVLKKMFAVPYSPWILRKDGRHSSIGLSLFAVIHMFVYLFVYLFVLSFSEDMS